MAELPSSSFARAVRLTALPLGMLGRAAGGLGRRLGGRDAAEITAELQARTAEQMFRVLGELKGGAMKLGQALSVFEAALPEEYAKPYREALTRLQEAAPPLPAEQVHGVLAETFGPRWRSRFREFDDRPVGAASLGQVHRAVWSDGRPVAVKVQYPGAGPALVSDLNQLARLSKLFGWLAPGTELRPLLVELRERAMEELDYAREAASQRAFAEAFAGDPDFLVPRVVAQSGTVLVGEWVTGTPLSKLISSGRRAERDRAGRLLLRLTLDGPARAGLLHADPHPGNFRLVPGERSGELRLGVLDFGAVARFPQGLPGGLGRGLRLALAGDHPELAARLRRNDFVKPEIDLPLADLRDFLEPLLQPLREPEFAFSAAWLRAQGARAADPRSPSFALGRRLNLPPSYLLIHRVVLGVTGILCQLGARVDVTEQLRRGLPGFAAESSETANSRGVDRPLRPSTK
jgi:predicted unusual protein kinase regulating ubiquinone biosynthesis (AarF/ABC1/UbiB family)